MEGVSPEPSSKSTDTPLPTKPLPGAAAFIGMGSTSAGCVAAGVVLGILGDDHWHTSPILLVVGLVVGVGAAAGTVVAQIRRYL